jgi:hypothetical protein
MNISFNLSDADFGAEERQLVREALGLASAAELAAAMPRLCKAAAIEYITMFVEKGMPSRADEVRQDRLYSLLAHYYQTRLPPDAEVSSIFQIPTSQSRTLLRNTRSRYRTKLGAQVDQSAKALVASARRNQDSEQWEMLIDTEVLAEELNLVISRKGPTLKPIQRKKNSAGQFEAEEDTYNLLKAHYGIS